MAIFHSYVSLPEGKQRTDMRASPCNGKMIFQHLPSGQNLRCGVKPGVQPTFEVTEGYRLWNCTKTP